MRIPRFNACHLALFAGLAAPGAHAMHLSPNGTGQVLIFPYYTVRNGFSTLLSIDNTQNNTKILKVRFREGLNGREVLDFNLFLSPNDTWTGAVVETSTGARLVTNDNSCVTPADLFSEARKDGLGTPLNAFKDYEYTGLLKDAESLATLDRTREGYFEVVEMGVVDPALSPAASQIVASVKQNAAGMPVDCPAMDRYDDYAGNLSTTRFPDIGATLLAPPTGGLRGRASLIGAASGANYSYSPTVLDAWSSRVAYASAGYRGATDLSKAFPTTSTVMTPAGVVMATWANGADAVSAVLMRETLTNEFVLDSGTNSQTDWVVTFPTKNFYVPTSLDSSAVAKAPFTSTFAPNGTGACDTYEYAVFNRDATSLLFDSTGIIEVHPAPPISEESIPHLCWTTNVSPFAATNNLSPSSSPSLLGSRARRGLGFIDIAKSMTTAGNATTPALRGGRQGPNGNATLRFNQSRQQLMPSSAVLVSPSGTKSNIPGKHFGLPVIGVMLHNYQNANVISNYGGIVEHSYSVRVE